MKLRVPIVDFRGKVIEIGQKPKPKTSGAGKKAAALKQARNKKLATALGGLALLIVIFALVWRSLSSPNYGDVAIISQETTATTKLPEYTSLSTNFYSLNYPENYSQPASDIAPPGILDQKTLASPDGQTKIVVSVKAAPYGGITLDSNYDYYIKHPERYKMSNKFYHGETIDTAASIKPPAEAAGLWLHNGFILTIIITSSAPQSQVDQQLKDMLSSIQFQE